MFPGMLPATQHRVVESSERQYSKFIVNVGESEMRCPRSRVSKSPQDTVAGVDQDISKSKAHRSSPKLEVNA